MIDMGIRLGAYDSVIAVCDPRRRGAIPVTLREESSPRVPTVFSLDRRTGFVRIGSAVRRAGPRELLCRGFLTPSATGYGPNFSPADAAECFLRALVKEALRRVGQWDIRNLILCLPEALLDIPEIRDRLQVCCDGLLSPRAGGTAELLGETAAAAAFLAGGAPEKPFSGELLLVDGNPPGLTLMQVDSTQNPNGTTGIRLRTLHRSRAGAGLPDFPEAVVREALGCGDAEAAHRLALELRSREEELRFLFTTLGTDPARMGPEDLLWAGAEPVFCRLPRDTWQAEVSVPLLARVYRERIYPALEAQLEELLRHFPEVRPALALWEGFPPVRLQVEDFFALTASNPRRQLPELRTACDAAACGGALIAAGILRPELTEP